MEQKNFNQNKSKKTKILVTAVSLSIIILIVLMGPVNALSIAFDGINANPYEVNQNVNFNASIGLNSNEKVTFDNLTLVLDLDKKKEKVICIFDVDGNIISGCNGINITLVSNTLTPSYGYLEGDGSLIYNININVKQSDLTIGNNKFYLVADTDAGKVSSPKENIVVKPSTPANGENSPVEKTKGKNK
ncbi:hypothetical protein HYW74_00825 [Candidatus Pacearchaeota archaeon]|nr:hypothetical protein [Candidatus Pacearchaeota archaeon]